MSIRRTAKRLLITVLVLLGMVILAVLALQTPYVRRYVANWIEQTSFGQRLGLQIGSLDYDLWTGQVAIDGLQLGAANPTFLEINHLELDLPILQLIEGNIILDRVLANGVAVDLVIGQDGTSNLPQFSTGNQPASNQLPNILIRQLTADGSAQVDDQQAAAGVNLPQWTLGITGTLGPEHMVDFQLNAPGTIQYQGRTQPLSQLTLNADVQRDAVNLTSLQLATPGLTLSSTNGTIDNFSSPLLNVDLQTQLDLEPLLQFAGVNPGMPLTGQLNAAITASNRSGSFTANTQIGGQGLRVDNIRQLGINAGASWNQATGVVDLNFANITAPEGQVQLAGTWRGNADTDLNDFSGTISRLNLRRVTQILNTPVQVASNASGMFRVQWPGRNYPQLTLQTNLRLNTSAQPAPNVVPLSGGLGINIRNRSLAATLTSIQSMGATLNGNVGTGLNLGSSNAVGGPLSGMVNIQIDDAGVALADVNSFRGSDQGATVNGEPVSGTLTLAAALGGTVSEPTADVSLNGSAIHYGRIDNATVDAMASYTPTDITVQEARITWRDTEIQAEGSVGLAQTPRPIQFTASTTEIGIPELLSLLQIDAPVTGQIQLNASGSGTMDDLQLAAQLTGNDLVAYGETLGTLTLDAGLANRVASIQTLRLERPDNQGTLNATGSVDFNAQTFTLDANTSQWPLDDLTLANNVTISGAIDLSASGSGSLTNPTLTAMLSTDNTHVEGREIGAINLQLGVNNGAATAQLDIPQYNLQGRAQTQLDLTPEPAPPATAAANNPPETTAPQTSTAGFNLTLPAFRMPQQVDAQLSVDNLDFDKLPWQGQPPVEGHITATVNASGDPAQFQDGTATLQVPTIAVQTASGEITNASTWQIRYANRTLELDSVELAGAGSMLTVGGSLPLGQDAAPGMITYSGNLDLQSLSSLAGENRSFDATGIANLSGQLNGTLESLTPTLRLSLQNGSVSANALKSPLSDIQLTAETQQGLIVLQQLTATLGNGMVKGTGSIPLGLFPLPSQIQVPEQTSPAQFQFNLTGLNLSDLATLPEQLRGTISVDIQAQATQPNLDALTATVTLPTLDLMIGGVPVTPSATPKLTLENGTLRIDQFALTGPATNLNISGGANLTDGNLQDLAVNGNVELGLIDGFSSNMGAQGDLRIQATIQGPLTQPTFQGSLSLDGGQFTLDSPSVNVSQLNLRATLEGNGIVIQQLTGVINGGNLTGSGRLDLTNGEINPDLTFTASDVFLDYPEGLRTLSTSNITLRPSGQNQNLLLGGKVTIQQGAYTDPLDLQTFLQDYLQSSGGVQLANQRSTFLSRLRFDIAITSQSPVLLQDNIGNLAFNLNLRLLGDFYRPGLTGQVTTQDQGQLRLAENNFVVQTGTITFINDTRIEPVFDFVATTQVANRNIQVTLTTDARGKIQAQLTSDNPSDTQADVLALLLTGKTADELQGRQLNAAGERIAASLLAGSVTDRLSQRLQSGLNLSRVSIQPNLISQESDPTARLTVGENLTRDLELIYSMDLTNSNDQIWQLNYNFLRRMNLRSTKQADNSYRFDFQHDLRWGRATLTAATNPPPKPPNIARIEFTGNQAVPTDILRKRLDVDTGKQYDFFKIRKGLNRIQSYYYSRGYLEAQIRPHRMTGPNGLILTIDIQEGPQVNFVYEGWSPSGGIRSDIRKEWEKGAFDAHRLQAVRAILRSSLSSKGYLRATIESDIQMPEPNSKRILFTILRGSKFSNTQIVFQGASGISPDTLKDQLKRANLDDKFETEPRQIRDFLRSYYQSQGYLDATVQEPRLDANAATDNARYIVDINEGPLFHWGTFTFTGNTVFTREQLLSFQQLGTDDVYRPSEAQDSRDEVEQQYWQRGYRDVTIDYVATPDAKDGKVNVDVAITEGPQFIVNKIDVAGNLRTSSSFVRSQVDLTPGQPLDYTKTAQSRRNLYGTGAYSAVELRTSNAENPDITGGMQRVDLVAQVQEHIPYRLRYGGFYDTDRGPGFLADLRNFNSLGGGRVIGSRIRYDNDVHELRGFFSQPLLHGQPFRTDSAVYVRREFTRFYTNGKLTDGFITDRSGLSIQEGIQLENRFFLTAGYRWERAHTYDLLPNAFIPFDVVYRVAPLTSSLTRDTRDELLDATHGSFTSHSFELSTKHLGASQAYWRYFGQFFKYIPLSAPSPIPFNKGLEKPRLIYASGIRVGLASGLAGQVLTQAEQFTAGGGTSIRGFSQNGVGIGNAMLVMNQELRFPIFNIFDGVGFVDLGNVYNHVSDFSFLNIRKTAGMGLRIRTPYLLLRLDYGRKLDRRPGESAGQFFFSIGQAF